MCIPNLPTARNTVHRSDVRTKACTQLYHTNKLPSNETNKPASRQNPSYTMREMVTTYRNRCIPLRCSSNLHASHTFALGSALKRCGGVRRQTQWASRVCRDPVPTVGASFVVQVRVHADASVRVLCARIRVIIGIRPRAETVTRAPAILYHGDKLIGATW